MDDGKERKTCSVPASKKLFPNELLPLCKNDTGFLVLVKSCIIKRQMGNILKKIKKCSGWDFKSQTMLCEGFTTLLDQKSDDTDAGVETMSP